MGARSAGRVALLAIHPGYADAILDGRKRVEFRKRPMSPDIHTVLLYATAPIKCIVGEFTVERNLVSPPADLWHAVGQVGGIDESAFANYYANSQTAIGIVVKNSRRYGLPVALTSLEPTPPIPQSFAYLPESALYQVRRLQAEQHQSALVGIATALAGLIAGFIPGAPSTAPAMSVAPEA